jgi:hypothetical protein
MAQLPGILPGMQSTFTYGQFRETASRFLSKRDLQILDGLSITPDRSRKPTGSALVDGWYRKERALRLTLEKARAARLKRDVSLSRDDEEIAGAYSDVQQIARTASAIENPLEAERYLDRARVDFLDQLRVGHFFDSDAVFAYGLTVLLHERGDKFTAEAGRESYTTIYNRILGE